MKRLREPRPNSLLPDSHVDRISELPRPVLHHILSFLPTKDATKTSALSKFWYSTWKSFPVLAFDQYDFHQSSYTGNGRKNRQKLEQNFCDYINNSINSRTGIASIQKFKVVVNFKRCANTRNGDLNRWLIYTIHKNVRDLTVTYHTTSKDTAKWQYVLPQSIIHSTTLQSLDLFGCQLIVSEFTDRVAFSLTTLRLSHVQMDTETLQNVISNCWQLQELSMELCKGFNGVKIAARQLQTLNLYLQRDHVQIVTVESPNLNSLTYGGGFANVQGSLVASPCFNRLQQLKFRDSDLVDEISQFFPKFPGLEKLEFVRCSILESLRISNANLVKISISQCVRLKNINIVNCRLRAFHYAQCILSFVFYGDGLQLGISLIRYRLMVNVVQGNDTATITMFEDVAAVFVGCPVTEYIASIEKGEHKSKYFRGLSLKTSTEYRFLFVLTHNPQLNNGKFQVVAEAIDRLPPKLMRRRKRIASAVSERLEVEANSQSRGRKQSDGRDLHGTVDTPKEHHVVSQEDDNQMDSLEGGVNEVSHGIQISSDDDATLSTFKKKQCTKGSKRGGKKKSTGRKIKSEQP